MAEVCAFNGLTGRGQVQAFGLQMRMQVVSPRDPAGQPRLKRHGKACVLQRGEVAVEPLQPDLLLLVRNKRQIKLAPAVARQAQRAQAVVRRMLGRQVAVQQQVRRCLMHFWPRRCAFKQHRVVVVQGVVKNPLVVKAQRGPQQSQLLGAFSVYRRDVQMCNGPHALQRRVLGQGGKQVTARIWRRLGKKIKRLHLLA